MTMRRKPVDHYSTHYSAFNTDLYAQIRRETFDEDYGQNGWQTAPELDRFTAALRLREGSRLLDVACGSGGPSLRIAEKTGCRVVGVDAHAQAIETAQSLASERGMAERAEFRHLNASTPLPFDDGSMDAVICIDAINHLPDRGATLRDWARLLVPGGRLLYADPIVVTGVLTSEEIVIRSSIGFFLFVPDGENERLVREAGLELESREDTTESVATIAGRWRAARGRHASELLAAEGEATFDGQQVFFEVAERLASERRLSRRVFVAKKAES